MILKENSHLLLTTPNRIRSKGHSQLHPASKELIFMRVRIISIATEKAWFIFHPLSVVVHRRRWGHYLLYFNRGRAHLIQQETWCAWLDQDSWLNHVELWILSSLCILWNTSTMEVRKKWKSQVLVALGHWAKVKYSKGTLWWIYIIIVPKINWLFLLFKFMFLLKMMHITASTQIIQKCMQCILGHCIKSGKTDSRHCCCCSSSDCTVRHFHSWC